MLQLPANALAVTSADPVLHLISPLGLAASAATALVVDLDPNAAGYRGPSLANLAGDGVRPEHLRPVRNGVAVLANGGISLDEAQGLVEILMTGWPAVVLRVPDPEMLRPTVPVLGLLPEPLGEASRTPAAYQQTRPRRPVPGPGMVLPPLGSAKVEALIGGRVGLRWRWIRAWRKAWELPWP